MGQRRIQRKSEPVKQVVAVDWRVVVVLVIALAVGTFGVYAQVRHHEFIQFDDPEYIVNNFHIQQGVTSEAVGWAFAKTGYCSNWHPLTWISHAIDLKWYGLKHPGGHHMTNVVLHIGSTILLFLALLKLTGFVWRSAFVAALFALHPMHVESVAWVAERKDTLSTLFWMLTMLAYAHYVKGKGNWKYALYVGVVISYALGLLAKPMLVTLPFVLLLLDWWPLERFKRIPTGKRGETTSDTRMALLDKVPLLGMAAFSSYMTYSVQRMGGAVASDSLRVWMRIDTAFSACAAYIAKLFWPANLAVVYPHPGVSLRRFDPTMDLQAYASVAPTLGLVVAYAVVLALTVMLLAMSRRKPYLGVGWLIFLGTLVPVSGLFVQVGEQGMADRYTYIPYLGLFIAIAWGIPELLSRIEAKKRNIVLGALAGLIILGLGCRTNDQLKYWQDNGKLFRHTLDIAPHNITAQINLGKWLEDKGKRAEAIKCYEAALDENPYHVRSLNLLATAYAGGGELQRAVETYQKALEVSPNDPLVGNNLGLVLNELNRSQEAAEILERVITVKPGFFQAYDNLGTAYRNLRQFDKSIEAYNMAIQCNPTFVHPYANRGLVYAMEGRFDEAIADYQRALEMDPNMGFVHARLGAAYYYMKRFPEALAEMELSRSAGFVPDPRIMNDLAARVGRR